MLAHRTETPNECMTALPGFAAGSDPLRAAEPALHIEALLEIGPERLLEAQRFINKRYAEEYQAAVQGFMPRLFALTDKDGQILGVVGVRDGSSPLFLECYLNAPIETLIGQSIHHPVTRQSIVEVGQFAGSSAGATREMICRLTAFLYHAGYRWVVFTGTRALRNGFRRLGLSPTDLGPAEQTRLPVNDPNHWGSYYLHQPRVQFGSIPQGFHALSRTRKEMQ